MSYKQSTIRKGWSCDPGTFVSIRPCAEEYDNKTFLGVYIGALSVNNMTHNPCIWVPDLQEYIFGFESWWGEIETPEQLHDISDADIQNVWYVRALKQLAEATPAPTNESR